MTWWAAVNPVAGRGGPAADRTRAALEAVGVAAELNVTNSGAHVAEVVAAGIGAGHRRFLAVGGDGTVNLVVDALMRHAWDRPPTLGILPAGTGCDFLRTFGIPQRLEDAAAHLTGDEVYRVDVGRLRGAWGERYFLNVAEAGLGAGVIGLAERLPGWLGRLRYKIAIWPTLVRFPVAEIELTTGGRSYEGPAVLVVMANAQYFGGGMNVAPRASLVDGALDIQVFSGPKRQAVILQPRITRGTHLTHRGVRRFEASRFELRTRPEWPVEVDGEYVGAGAVVGDVVAGALDVKI